MDSNKLAFNNEWLTVFVELTQLFSEVLREEAGMTVTQYRILLELHACEGSLPAFELANRLVVKPPSVTNAADYLEQRGLIKRIASIHDRRLLGITIESEGKEVLERASRVLSRTIDELWQDFTEEEREIIVESTRYATQELKGYSYVSNGGKIKPFYITAIVVMTQLWTDCAKKNYRLSLSEARILMLLNENERLLNGAKIAATLTIDTSGVSRAITKLADQEYVVREKVKNNRKNSFIKLTDVGKKVAELIRKDLYQIHAGFYGTVPRKDYGDLNRINMGMYYAIRRFKIR